MPFYVIVNCETGRKSGTGYNTNNPMEALDKFSQSISYLNYDDYKAKRAWGPEFKAV